MQARTVFNHVFTITLIVLAMWLQPPLRGAAAAELTPHQTAQPPV